MCGCGCGDWSVSVGFASLPADWKEGGGVVRLVGGE